MPAKDVERIACRFQPDASYRSHPFRDVTTTHGYITRAFGEEELVRCWFGEPVVENYRATVEYWAIARTPRGGDVTIAGTAVLRFDPHGLVSDHRDYWDQRDGAIEPPSG